MIAISLMIFVSYARRDEHFVDQLITALEQHRVETWVDRHSIPGGTHWEAEISRALEACSAVVVVLSPALGESAHVATELSLAQDYKRPIIPIVQRPWEPSEHSEHTYRLKFLLSGLQFIDFSILGFDRGVEDLLRAISAAPVRPPEPPRRWRSFRRSVVVGGLVLAFVAVAAVLISRGPRPPTRGGGMSPSALLQTVPRGTTELATSVIEGTWYADVAYSWGVRASEQFEFRVDGERLLGTATFGGARFPRRVLEGRLAGDRLSFITKPEVPNGRGEREAIYQYTGRVTGSGIQFTLDNEGEPATRFVAARTPQEARNAAPRLATGGTDPRLSFLEGGPYSLDSIKAKLGEQQEAIRSCYVATEFDPVEHAYVHYFVRIGPDGKVTEVGAPGSDQRSAELDRCMGLVFHGVNWGPPPDGKSAEIRLGFKALPSWRSQ